jgi:hypothetical protein
MRQTSTLCISFIKACKTISWTSLNNPRIKLGQKWVLWIDGKNDFGAETQYVQRQKRGDDHAQVSSVGRIASLLKTRFFGFDGN